MTEEIKYETLLDVIADEKFPEVDCMLRQGKHIGHEDVSKHSFLENTHGLLNEFYSKYRCELVHDTHDGADFFYLSAYGDVLGKRQLSPQEMVTGMVLAFMMMDPEYLTRQIPFDNIVRTMKMLLGEENFRARMAPRFRGKNTEGDEQKAIETMAKALRKLEGLGFLHWPRSSKQITPYTSIFRFLGPVRGIGNLEENIKILVGKGMLEIDQFVGEDEEATEELENE
jgi:chromosome partition protein MukE